MSLENIKLQNRSIEKRTSDAEEHSSGSAVQFWLGPHNEGLLENPDTVGRVTGPCGDTMEISLRIEGNKIIDSRFQVVGCQISKACASMAAALAREKELEEAWDINENNITECLPSIPENHRHCPVLARDTLRQAIEKYIKQARGKGL